MGKCGQTAAKQAPRALPRRQMLRLYMWRMPQLTHKAFCSRVHQSLLAAEFQTRFQTVAAESESTEQQQQMAEAATSSKKQRKKQRNKARKGHSSAIQPSQVQQQNLLPIEEVSSWQFLLVLTAVQARSRTRGSD